MQCAFGQVIDQKMHYSPVGQIVAEEWTNAEILRSNITLDQWIVKPNHVHGIIQIKNVETSRRDVSTGLRPNSIGSIIGQFKAVFDAIKKILEPPEKPKSPIGFHARRNDN